MFWLRPRNNSIGIWAVTCLVSHMCIIWKTRSHLQTQTVIELSIHRSRSSLTRWILHVQSVCSKTLGSSSPFHLTVEAVKVQSLCGTGPGYPTAVWQWHQPDATRECLELCLVELGRALTKCLGLFFLLKKKKKCILIYSSCSTTFWGNPIAIPYLTDEEAGHKESKAISHISHVQLVAEPGLSLGNLTTVRVPCITALRSARVLVSTAAFKRALWTALCLARSPCRLHHYDLMLSGFQRSAEKLLWKKDKWPIKVICHNFQLCSLSSPMRSGFGFSGLSSWMAEDGAGKMTQWVISTCFRNLMTQSLIPRTHVRWEGES